MIINMHVEAFYVISENCLALITNARLPGVAAAPAAGPGPGRLRVTLTCQLTGSGNESLAVSPSPDRDCLRIRLHEAGSVSSPQIVTPVPLRVGPEI